MLSLRTLLLPVRPLCLVRPSSTKTKWLPFEKKQYLRNKGYEPHIYTKGLYPRIPGDPGPLPRMLHEDVKDDWDQAEALFGQNDYIDILGDGNIHPARLLTNVPWWLRGFNGLGKGGEIKMLNRARFARWHYQQDRPKEWDRMKKRVDWLFNWMNKHKRPPRPVPYK